MAALRKRELIFFLRRHWSISNQQSRTLARIVLAAASLFSEIPNPELAEGEGSLSHRLSPVMVPSKTTISVRAVCLL